MPSCLSDAGSCQIADFGLSDFYPPGATRRSHCGSFAYLAPEVRITLAHIEMNPLATRWSRHIDIHIPLVNHEVLLCLPPSTVPIPAPPPPSTSPLSLAALAASVSMPIHPPSAVPPPHPSLSLLSPPVSVQVFKGTSNAGPPIDVWALGVMLFAMLCGRLPFDANSGKLGKGGKKKQAVPQSEYDEEVRLML